MITITGLGDHDQLDWLITMTGIRRLTEGRAWLQALWRVSANLLAAAGAATTEQSHPCHIWFDRWKFDAVVDLLGGLGGFPKRRPTLGTGTQRRINHAVGGGMQ